MRGVFLLLCLTLTFVKPHRYRYRGPRYINLGVVGISRPRFIRGRGSGFIDLRTLRPGGTSFGSVRGPSFVSRTTRVSTFGGIGGGLDIGEPGGARFVTSSTYLPRISLAGTPGSVAPGVTDNAVSYVELYGRVSGPIDPTRYTTVGDSEGGFDAGGMFRPTFFDSFSIPVDTGTLPVPPVVMMPEFVFPIGGFIDAADTSAQPPVALGPTEGV